MDVKRGNTLLKTIIPSIPGSVSFVVKLGLLLIVRAITLGYIMLPKPKEAPPGLSLGCGVFVVEKWTHLST